jgi:hypothetical protein
MLEDKSKTPLDIHEHRQFIEMMRDVHEDAQLQRQLKPTERIANLETQSACAISDVTEAFSQLDSKFTLPVQLPKQKLITQYHLNLLRTHQLMVLS